MRSGGEWRGWGAGRRDGAEEMQVEVEEPAPGGALRYDQYFPTMLPFQRPEAEAALQGEQPLEVATADAASLRVSPYLLTTPTLCCRAITAAMHCCIAGLSPPDTSRLA